MSLKEFYRWTDRHPLASYLVVISIGVAIGLVIVANIFPWHIFH